MREAVDYMTAKMRQDERAKLFIREEVEERLGREMGKFANERVDWTIKERSEVFRRGDVGRPDEAALAGLDTKAEGFVGAGTMAEFAEPREVAVANGEHAQSSPSERLPVPPRMDCEAEGQHALAQVAGMEPVSERNDPFAGHEERQRAAAAFEPEVLDEHRQPADVIGVEVAQEDRLDPVRHQPEIAQRAAAWLPTIEQDACTSELQHRRGVRPAAAGPSVAGSQKKERVAHRKEKDDGDGCLTYG